jgi:DNA-binding transcriptional ArsR family regulator
MGPADFARIRFAYSPLAELAESLYVLGCEQVPVLHRPWYEWMRGRLGGVDMDLLRAIVPVPRAHVVSFLLSGATAPHTTIERQLDEVAACPPDRLRRDLGVLWGDVLPAIAEDAIRDGGRVVADALANYWAAAIEPHWSRIRSVLDDDVAYRAGRLANGGIEGLLRDLHPELELTDRTLHVVSSATGEHELSGQGLLLVPCVFAWPHIMIDPGNCNMPSITYGPRGVGQLWANDDPAQDDDALGALLGFSRAAILVAVDIPKSTSDLATELEQSAPSVSGHLSVLKRAGLVTSWRSGRRVLYQRTPLATSVIAATGRARKPITPASATADR